MKRKYIVIIIAIVCLAFYGYYSYLAYQIYNYYKYNPDQSLSMTNYYTIKILKTKYPLSIPHFLVLGKKFTVTGNEDEKSFEVSASPVDYEFTEDLKADTYVTEVELQENTATNNYSGSDNRKTLLYFSPYDQNLLTTENVPGSHSVEIQMWRNAGYEIDFLNSNPSAGNRITASLLMEYEALRIMDYNRHYFTDSEGNAIALWVQSGGSLLASIPYNEDVKAVYNFGVERIDGAGGGNYGTTWNFHGAPLVINSFDNNSPFRVAQLGIEALDRPVLRTNSGLNIAATYSGYPVVVYRNYGSGKVVITFDSGAYCLDVVHPGNAYRSCISSCNNYQFTQNSINYLSY